MSEPTSAPQHTFDKLILQASDLRRIRSLEALHQVCGLLNDRGSSDFSYKNIVNVGKDRGLSIPSEKTIVNSTGAHYRELIHAWKAGVMAANSKIKSDTWIDSITDPVVRMSVIMLAKELRALKAKEARKNEYTASPIIINPYAGHAVHKSPLLNSAELDSLKSAIDPSRLALAGLTIGSRGEITDNAGRLIQKPGFRGAIEKILAVQSPS